MYPVSDAYLEEILKDSVTAYWYGSIRTRYGMTYSFDVSAIVQGSGKITREICTGSDIEIGTTCAAELDINLCLPNVSRYELYNGEVALTYQLTLPGGGLETIPIGTFYITEPPERTLDITSIHAYDAMSKFNKSFDTNLVGFPYDFLRHACESCGVTLGSTQEEIANLPNGSVETHTYPDLEIYTYRDLVGYTAAYLGCFSYVGPDNKLYVKPYGMDPVRNIEPEWRYEYKPMDYEAFYTILEAYFAISEEKERVVIAYGGLTYDMGTNPLIQFNSDETRLGVLSNILTALARASYTPFKASVPCDPSLMPGDVVTFSGNHAVEGMPSAITKQVIAIGGAMEISCSGSDPNLAVLTANEKKYNSIAKSKNKDGMFYYDYTNAAEILIGDGNRAAAISFRYMTTKRTHVDFHAEIKCVADTTEEYEEESDTYVENDGMLEVVYRMGGDDVTSYYPLDTLEDGKRLRHLVYTWWASENIVSTFEVFIRCVGCSLYIDQGDIHAYIAGVGLEGETSVWTGKVNIDDNFYPVDFRGIHKLFDSAVEATLPEIHEPTVRQGKKYIDFAGIRKQIGDGVTNSDLHRYSPPYNDNQVAKTNVVRDGSVWRLENEEIVGTLTTPSSIVDRIYKLTSHRAPGTGDVNYIVSFDSGETWYSYAQGFVELTELDSGMAEVVMESITEEEWAVMIAENHTVMVRAIMWGDATLTDIQIYTSEART